MRRRRQAILVERRDVLLRPSSRKRRPPHCRLAAHRKTDWLANDYSGYITTPEEYNSQEYEGASTLFGPLTFDAYLQLFEGLAIAMAGKQPVPPGVPPLPLDNQIELQTGVVMDEVPLGDTFGQVIEQPPTAVQRGGIVAVLFRGSHPKNDSRRNNTYFRIERNTGGNNWDDLVAWDSMPQTRMTWFRPPAGGALSNVGVRWDIPLDAPIGTYRIVLSGKWKSLDGRLTEYTGTTRNFQVQ
jgi:neutral ceramidase